MAKGTPHEFPEPHIFCLLRRLNSFLRSAGVRPYLVGGLVRDLILKRKTADIDIAVQGDALVVAEDVAKLMGGTYVLLHEENRIGRVVLPDKTGVSGRSQWVVDFTTIEDTIYDDLARRDFTIDATAYDLAELIHDPEQALLIDPFGGLNDLHDRLVRAVSTSVFTDDPLRLLRAFRLSADLNFTIDDETEFLIKSDSYLIATVAGERIRGELLRLMVAPKIDHLLLYMNELGVLTAVIPELAETRGIAQPKEHYWNVFEHMVETAAAAAFLIRDGSWEYAGEEALETVPWTEEIRHYFNTEVNPGSTRGTLLRLAALLHDIAKPETKAVDKTGRTRFFGHGLEGADTTVEILERLRFSTHEIKLVTAMVKYHMRPGQLAQDMQLPSAHAIYRYFRDTEEAGIATIFLNLADHLAARGPKLEMPAWEAHTRVSSFILAEHFKQASVTRQEKIIDGNDLMKELGLEPGPAVGELLEQLREAQAAGEIKNHDEAIEYAKKLLHRE
jgi:poly(A) polymerase